MVVAACLSLLVFSGIAQGTESLEPLYDISEAATLKSEEYSVKGRNLSLFPVPQNNAVGTNDLNNAITLLSFSKGKIKYDQYFKNAFSQVVEKVGSKCKRWGQIFNIDKCAQSR
jgi:hypothetical protein